MSRPRPPRPAAPQGLPTPPVAARIAAASAVVLQLGGQRVQAAVVDLQLAPARVWLVPAVPGALPFFPGLVLRLWLGEGAAAEALVCRVVEVDGGRIALALPQAPAHGERRARARVRLGRGCGVVLMAENGPRYVVFDASASGLGLVMPRSELVGAEQRGLAGTLVLGLSGSLPVVLEVRHHRLLHADDPSTLVVGTRFVGLGLDDQLRVVQAAVALACR